MVGHLKNDLDIRYVVWMGEGITTIAMHTKFS